MANHHRWAVVIATWRHSCGRHARADMANGIHMYIWNEIYKEYCSLFHVDFCCGPYRAWLVGATPGQVGWWMWCLAQWCSGGLRSHLVEHKGWHLLHFFPPDCAQGSFLVGSIDIMGCQGLIWVSSVQDKNPTRCSITLALVLRALHSTRAPFFDTIPLKNVCGGDVPSSTQKTQVPLQVIFGQQHW